MAPTDVGGCEDGPMMNARSLGDALPTCRDWCVLVTASLTKLEIRPFEMVAILHARPMTPVLVLAILGVLLCASASFFFALAETSLFALGGFRARNLRETPLRRAESVTTLLSEPQELLATIVLGNAFANS